MGCPFLSNTIVKGMLPFLMINQFALFGELSVLAGIELKCVPFFERQTDFIYCETNGLPI